MKTSPLFTRLLIVASFLLTPFSALAEEKEPFRFRGGDPDRGKLAFRALECHACHRVAGVDLPDPPAERPVDLTLGGEPIFAATYQDLVLAITAPKHVMREHYRDILFGNEMLEPVMPRLTREMTAQQLIDLMSFLDGVYRKNQPEYESPNP